MSLEQNVESVLLSGRMKLSIIIIIITTIITLIIMLLTVPRQRVEGGWEKGRERGRERWREREKTGGVNRERVKTEVWRGGLRGVQKR